MKRIIAFALALSVIAAVTPASAFHQLSSFRRTANEGGGSGYYFTGSPRFKGYTCGLCHTGAERKIRMEMSSTPPGLLDGVYEPGMRYQIDLRMVGEHRGLESAFNPNTFTAEVVDAAGAVGGRFGIDRRPPMAITADERIVSGDGFGEGESEWRFFWVAPEDADVRPLTLYLGMLDGDGASDTEERRIDALNDDFVTATLRLCPMGQECPADEPLVRDKSPTACSAGTPTLAIWLGLALFFGVVRRRRHRRRVM